MSQTPTNHTSTALQFDCDVCAQRHDIPLNMGFSVPDVVNKLLPWEKESRCKYSEDWCIIDEQFYYIRGCLQVPIAGTNNIFSWGVWTTLSEEDFDRTMELWSDESRSAEPDYKGSLANTLPTYKETRTVNLAVRTRAVGDRPLLLVTDEDHGLFNHQRQGMPMERAIELAKLVLHSGSNNPYGHLCEK
jgi:hypothetical protein